MRITNKNTTKPRKGKVYESESFKDGQFTEEELKQYGLSDNEIATILEYQSLLPMPILQENENNTISAKELHNQLKVSRDFSTWIKQQIEDLELVENIDYFIDSPLKGSGLVDYQLKLSDAKEIAMLAGSKGGRTSEELKKMSKLVRKYFIAIEKAFKNRTNWNTNRKNTHMPIF